MISAKTSWLTKADALQKRFNKKLMVLRQILQQKTCPHSLSFFNSILLNKNIHNQSDTKQINQNYSNSKWWVCYELLYWFDFDSCLNMPSTLLLRPIHPVSCQFPSPCRCRRFQVTTRYLIIIVVVFSNPFYYTRGYGCQIFSNLKGKCRNVWICMRFWYVFVWYRSLFSIVFISTFYLSV